MERGALQVGHYCAKRDIAEIHPEMPIIHGISAFQVHRIYRETFLQYSPNPWVSAPRSDISRSRNSAPKSPNIENSPAGIHPPPSPFSTTIRTSWRTESRPILHAESTCHLRLSIAPLVLPLLPESVPILADPEFFCWAPHHHFPLKSEHLGERNQDQFCAPKPPVISVCP